MDKQAIEDILAELSTKVRETAIGEKAYSYAALELDALEALEEIIAQETKKAEVMGGIKELIWYAKLTNTWRDKTSAIMERLAELQESEGNNLATEKLNEKHQELLAYLKTREPSRATYRDIIKNTSLNSIGSVQFGLEKLESLGLIKRVARSSYRVVESEGEG